MKMLPIIFFLEYCGLDNQTHRIIIEANSLIISYMQVLFKKWKKKKKETGIGCNVNTLGAYN